MAKKALHGWKKAVFYNPGNGDRVQLNRISTEFSEIPADPNIKTQTGTGVVFGGQNWPVTVGFLDADGLALLETWQVAYTPVRLAIWAPAGMSVLFNESEEIFMQSGTGTDARPGVKVHQATIEAIGWPLDIRQLKNLARAISFSSNQGDLVFPFAGITLTLAADYSSPSGAGLLIEAKDFAGNVVGSSSQTASEGRMSTQITLPAGTYSLDIDLLDGGSGDVSNISLRGDGSDEYISF